MGQGKTDFNVIKESELGGGGDMVRWVKVLVAKPDVPSLISKTHVVEGRRGPTLASCPLSPQTNKWIKKQTNKQERKKLSLA